ncbi:MAG: sulfatase-like hydrolase/transferase, partial [Planctomycetota bacterium]
MNHRSHLRLFSCALLYLLVVVAGLVGARSVTAAEAPRPNVLVILCDDLGYGDLACYGHPTIRTPHLDRLARQGIRLTDCYAASAVCSSSRAGLLTGRNPNRSGIYDWLPDGIPVYLSSDEPSVAKSLSAAGYRTAMVGKWHLNGRFNDASQPQPDAYGFEHWMATQNNASPSHRSPVNFVRNGKPVGRLDGFSSHEVAGEAIRWLDETKDDDRPFYLHVCFHEPHEPVASPQDLVDSYASSAKNDDQAQYFANVTNMDAAVGKLVQALEDRSLTENTLVIFTSDNGPETLNRYRSANRSWGTAGPLREMKLHTYEGGIRVPGIVRWPQQVPGGQVIATPVSSVDLLPTLCELAGTPAPTTHKLDGVSLVSLFQGEPLKRTQPLFWFYYRALTPPRFAVREGDWKMLAAWDHPLMMEKRGGPGGRNINPQAIEMVKTAKLDRFELYNLASDIGEQRNVIDDHPDR